MICSYKAFIDATPCIFQSKMEQTMNILFASLSSIFAFIKEEFDLDPANLWLR